MKKFLTGIMALALFATPLALASPAEAVTPEVSIASSASTVTVGQSVTLTAAIRRGGSQQKVTLQRKQGTSWTRIATKSLPQTGAIKRVAFTQRINARGPNTFRVVLAPKGRYAAARSGTVTVRATPAATPLRFDFTGAQGLAMRQTRASTARVATLAATGTTDTTAAISNLGVVTPTGLTRDAVVSGDATISNFLIAPNGKVYVVFRTRVNLDDTSQDTNNGCLLAEVDPSTGTPRCIDSTLSYINWQEDGNPPVQFDASGAAYYLGSTTSGNVVLRRYDSGATTNLINDNVYVSDFVVLPDGSVIVTGSTASTGTSWTRRITPTGGLQTLFNKTWALALFPDSNVYFFSQASAYDIYRFLTDTMQLDPAAWLDGGGFGSTAHFHCGAPWLPNTSSPTCIFDAHKRAVTSDGQVFVRNRGEARLFKVYPTYEGVNLSTVAETVLLRAVGTQVLVVGRSANGANLLTKYDPATGAETPLIDAGNEIELYHLNPVDDTTAMFDGLRFSDNTVVVGQIDVTTGQVTVVNTLTSKWEDFQTFTG
jgi:hypothetical protein